MRDGHRPGQAADVDVGHQAGVDGRLGHLVGLAVEVQRHRRDPHRGADARRGLARLAGRDAPLQPRQHLAEAPPDAAVGPHVGALGRGHPQVQFGQPVQVDPAALQQHVAQRHRLLRVVGVEPRHPPAIRLLLPGPRAIDVIVDQTVVRPDLLGTEPLQRGPQRISDG